MKLIELITDSFVDSLSKVSQYLLDFTVMNTVASLNTQNAKNIYPPVNAFRDGLMKVKCLTGKERYGKLFAFAPWIFFTNVYLCSPQFFHFPFTTCTEVFWVLVNI